MVRMLRPRKESGSISDKGCPSLLRMCMQKSDGMNYAPEFSGEIKKVVKKDEFRFSICGLKHGHVFAMTNGLLEAGATLVSVYDDDIELMNAFCRRYPGTRVSKSEEEVINDPDIHLVVSAAVPCMRARLGIKVMKAGKDYFCDKPGALTLEEVECVREACAETKRKYMVYFGERIHVEGAVFAEQEIKKGRIGRVVHVTILAPHRLNSDSRPSWFFDPDKNGSILCDIGSHQIEQFLTYTGNEEADITHAYEANYANPDHPYFHDYGECTLLGTNGATGIVRVDWFTPSGLGAWGDGRVFVVGTKGTIEIRKYVDIAQNDASDYVYIVDGLGENVYSVHGQMGFPFFPAFILDSLNRTEEVMTQQHVISSMRLAVEASLKASEKRS